MTTHYLSRTLFVALLVPILTACTSPLGAQLLTPATQRPQRTVILTAFGDAAATYGETKPFLLALKDKQDRTHTSAFCEGVYEGEISGQPVVVVTTGTGGDNAGPCMQDLLHLYPGQIKEVIWSGIGGVTPAVGGIIDGAGQRRTDAEPVMIGDVCISALSWNYDLHFSSVSDWAATATADDRRFSPSGGWWPMRTASGTTAVPGFENVQQYVIAPKELADELLNAAREVTWPVMDPAVQAKVATFFPQIRPTQVFDYSQCGEVASNNFWHGAVEDRLSLQYLASLITASGYAGDTTVSEDDVVVFSAMEASAWMSVLQSWNNHRNAQIPMAVIRAASNYDQIPLNVDDNPPLASGGRPMTAMQDIEQDFQEAGSAFAASNAAASVLKLLEIRGDNMRDGVSK